MVVTVDGDRDDLHVLTMMIVDDVAVRVSQMGERSHRQHRGGHKRQGGQQRRERLGVSPPHAEQYATMNACPLSAVLESSGFHAGVAVFLQ